MSPNEVTMASLREKAAIRSAGHTTNNDYDYVDSSCPMCGYPNLKVEYVRDRGCEYLHLFCSRCHYGWDKPTLRDAQRGGKR